MKIWMWWQTLVVKHVYTEIYIKDKAKWVIKTHRTTKIFVLCTKSKVVIDIEV